MSENINTVLHDARETKDTINAQVAQRGFADPLLEARMQRLEKKLNTLTANKSGFSENLMGLDPNGQYRDAFLQYLKKGDITAISQLPPPRVRVNEAGFIAAPTMEALIHNSVSKLSVIRQIASVTQVSADSLDLAVESDGCKASWGEPSSVTTVVKQYIKAYDIVAQPKITAKLLEDNEVDVESYIAGKIAEAFARAEDESFLNGDGACKPTGMLTLTAGKSANQIETISGSLTFADLMHLASSLDTFYAGDTAYLMSKETESQIRFLKDTNDHYIWRPADNETPQSTILGIPVFTTSYMPHGSGTKSIIFGNFKQGYQIVERAGISILRDPFTEKPFVKFYTLRRVGGNVIDGRALKVFSQSS